jgi:phosphotriesterase-related protein
MAVVETVRGPVDVDSLGLTLMHEHVFILNEEIRQNYPADWSEDDRVDDAIVKLNALAARGCRTIVDPTVVGLGRDIRRIRRVADGTDGRKMERHGWTSAAALAAAGRHS